MSDDSQNLSGAQTPNSATSDYNAQMFVILQALARVRTTQLVKIMAVTNSGDVSAGGFVDVMPMVHQLDGENNAVPHGVVYGIPYMRLQGGVNAVIIDPVVGDIGFCVFADRDISSVKSAKDFATPGSSRQFSMSDGLYIGGVLNGTPTQYVRFSNDGVAVVSPTQIKFTAPTVIVEASNKVQLNTPSVEASTLVTVPTVTASAKVSAPLVEGTTDVTYAGHSAVAHVHSGGTISGFTGPTKP